MLDPSKQSTCRVHREREPFFVGSDAGVGVDEESGWQIYGGSSRKLDDHFDIPQNQMASLSVVVVSQGSDAAPPKREILNVNVRIANCPRSKVQRETGKHLAVPERQANVGVLGHQSRHRLQIVYIQLWSPRQEALCKPISL